MFFYRLQCEGMLLLDGLMLQTCDVGNGGGGEAQMGHVDKDDGHLTLPILVAVQANRPNDERCL